MMRPQGSLVGSSQSMSNCSFISFMKTSTSGTWSRKSWSTVLSESHLPSLKPNVSLGNPKTSQPPPASMHGSFKTSLKNARSATVSLENRVTWAPAIMFDLIFSVSVCEKRFLLIHDMKLVANEPVHLCSLAASFIVGSKFHNSYRSKRTFLITAASLETEK